MMEPLVECFLEINSPRCAWIVDLSLVDVECSPLDLRQITKMENLFSLTIFYSCKSQTSRTGCAPFDDDVLENLGYHASTHGALPNLSKLLVYNAPGVTLKSLNHLSRFPMLDTFQTARTNINPRQVAAILPKEWQLSEE